MEVVCHAVVRNTIVTQLTQNTRGNVQEIGATPKNVTPIDFRHAVYCLNGMVTWDIVGTLQCHSSSCELGIVVNL